MINQNQHYRSVASINFLKSFNIDLSVEVLNSDEISYILQNTRAIMQRLFRWAAGIMIEVKRGRESRFFNRHLNVINCTYQW